MSNEDHTVDDTNKDEMPTWRPTTSAPDRHDAAH